MSFSKKINRIINIKTIGWTSFIFFGLGMLYCLFQLIALFLIFDDPTFDHLMRISETAANPDQEMASAFYWIKWAAFGTFIWLMLLNIGSIGLIRRKHWGRILYHLGSMPLILGLLALILIMIINFQFDPALDDAPIFQQAISKKIIQTQRFYLITYGTFILIITWLLSRVNLLLMKRSYREEFH